METPGPVPPTPHRELRDDDLFDEDAEEALPTIAVKEGPIWTSGGWCVNDFFSYGRSYNRVR